MSRAEELTPVQVMNYVARTQGKESINPSAYQASRAVDDTRDPELESGIGSGPRPVVRPTLAPPRTIEVKAQEPIEDSVVLGSGHARYCGHELQLEPHEILAIRHILAAVVERKLMAEIEAVKAKAGV